MTRVVLFTSFLLLVLLPASAAEPTEEERALKQADAALEARVNRAIRAGAQWLRSRQGADGSFPARYTSSYPMGPTALAVLALLHSGVPRSDPVILKGFDHLRKQYERLKGDGTHRMGGRKVYSIAITIMALAQLGKIGAKPGDRYGRGGFRLDKPDLAWMREMTAWLIGVQQSNGAWRYPENGYDNSNSQYALLSLKEARRVGLKVPDKVFIKALDHWLDQQEKDGPKVRRQTEKGGDGVYSATRSVAKAWDRARGWGYCEGDTATGSMTTAGVAAVAIARSEIRRGTLQAKADRSMRDGLAWLGKHFSVEGNPGRDGGRRGWHYYYLYGLERAGVLAGVVYMGEHRWYVEGARYLVGAQQGGGGWSKGMRGLDRAMGRRMRRPDLGVGDVVDTCFALLFLVRSTAHSYGVPTPRELVGLRGGDRQSDRALSDLFRAAFSEMAHLGEREQQARAREFAWLGPRVIRLLLPKLSSSETAIRARAIRVLRAITNLEMGYDPEAPEEQRESAAERWTLWYLQHRTTLTLDAASRLIGRR
jgi:hypothetical protein